jgi:hypothetical protein
MAITLNTSQVATSGFCVTGTSADASACEELVAAPGTGRFIILQHLTISNGSGGTQSITVGAGEAANDCEAVILGPFSMLASTQLQFNFYGGGTSLPANKSLTVDSNDTHDLTIFAQGVIK